MNTIKEFQGEHRWLSNFVLVSVMLDGERYASTEHAYQAAKTLSFKERIPFQQSRNPGEAKRLGRKVTMRADWNNVKEQVMLDLLRQKFQYPAFRSALLNTGNAHIEEGNSWGDTYWGVCRGVGKNRLGMLLMQVRSELAREDLA